MFVAFLLAMDVKKRSDHDGILKHIIWLFADMMIVLTSKMRCEVKWRAFVSGVERPTMRSNHSHQEKELVLSIQHNCSLCSVCLGGARREWILILFFKLDVSCYLAS
jgi:hypothetical protein